MVAGGVIDWFTQGTQCTSNARLDGRVVVITGANTGIGKYTAPDMSRRGAKVVLLCRDLEKAEAAAEDIRKETKGEILVYRLDLASLRSVRNCAKWMNSSLDKVDILINNAGVMACPEARTEDGFEMQFGTNHLGHFLLTNLLLPVITRGAPGARIINVSSMAHMMGSMQWEDLNWENTSYSPMRAYSQSKLANILFSKELARRLEGSGVTVYTLHPGAINTEIARHVTEHWGSLGAWASHMVRPFIKTVESGSQTTIYCAVEESIGGQSGRYYSECKETRPMAQADNMKDARRLW